MAFLACLGPILAWWGEVGEILKYFEYPTHYFSQKRRKQLL